MSLTPKYPVEFAGRFTANTTTLDRYPGMPVGSSLNGDWFIEEYILSNSAGQDAIVDNPNAPDETLNGAEWVQTQITSSTMTIVENTGPAYLNIATAAVAGQGQQMQALGPAGDRTLYDPATLKHMWMEALIMFTDANDDDDAVGQMEFFLGFAPADTSLGTSVQDFWGLYSADGSTLLTVIADDDTVALESATGSSTVCDLANESASLDGTNVAGEIIRVGFAVRDIDQTNNQARVFGFFENGGTRNHERQRRPAQLGSPLQVTEVPDAAGAPSLMFLSGEALAKNLRVYYIRSGFEYVLG